MKIAFVTYEYPPDTPVGGIGTYTVQVAALLQKNGFDVHVFSGSHHRQETVVEEGVTIHRVLCAGPHDFQIKIVDTFKAEHIKSPFDLMESAEIHANAKEVKHACADVPLIVRLHAPNHLVESYKKRYVSFGNKLRFFLGALKRGKWDLGYWKKYDYVNDPDYAFAAIGERLTAPSLQMKKWIVEHWRLEDKLIEVIENPFIENRCFDNAITENAEKVIIFFGRLNILKGLYTATFAMQKILKDNPEWKWMVIGDDGKAADGILSMREWMKKRLSAVLPQVKFYDSVAQQQLAAYLKEGSIVLVPSLFESYSYVTIEAMSAGKVVLGSSGTGIASLITNGQNGLLADPFDINDWRMKIQYLINDKTLRKKLGKEALLYVHSKQETNDRIVEFYKSFNE